MAAVGTGKGGLWWRQSQRRRVLGSAVVGLLFGVGLAWVAPWQLAVLAAWDVVAVLVLSRVWFRVGRFSPDQTGIAALGDHRGPRRAARPKHPSDLVSTFWPNDTTRRALVAARPVGLVAGPRIRVDRDVSRSHHPHEYVDQTISRHAKRTYQPEPHCQAPTR